MKQNYKQNIYTKYVINSCIYDGLSTSLSEAITFLNKVEDTQKLVTRITPLTLSAEYYKAVQKVIKKLQALQEDIDWSEEKMQEENRDYAEQIRSYQINALVQKGEKPSLRQEQANLHLAKYALERLIVEFKKLFDDVYSDIKELCSNKDEETLNKLASKNKWIKEILSNNNGELAIIAINNNNLEILQLLLSNNKEFKKYEIKLLEAAAENAVGGTTCLTFLLSKTQGMYELPIIIDFLQGNSNKYFYENEKIKNIFLEKLVTVNSNLSDHYKAMYYYSLAKNKLLGKEIPEADSKQEPKKLLTKAKGLFDRIIKNNSSSEKEEEEKIEYVDEGQNYIFLPLDFLFSGLCSQYLNDQEKAKEVFSSLENFSVDEKSKYFGIQKIKNIASAHMESAEKVNKFKNDIEAWNKDNKKESTLENYYEGVSEGLKKLKDNITNNASVTQIRDELIKYILKSRHDSLKNDLKEKTDGDEAILLYNELKTLPELKEIYKSQIQKSNHHNIYKEYKDITKSLENALSLIGEITEGIVLEDVM